MISRVAEHCFWLSRYLERAENTSRVLEVNQTLLLDFHVPVDQQWQPLLTICGIHDYDGDISSEAIQEYMTWDEKNAFSITSSLACARENARIIREVIPLEMWERMNYYHLWMQSPTCRLLYTTNRGEFYAQIRRINQLLHGIGDATMSHGEPWDFYLLGLYLERASQTARILDVKYHFLQPNLANESTPVDNAHWIAILMSCSGYEPFHKINRIITEPSLAVADFLIFDPQFPRSLRFCLRQCLRSLCHIRGEAEVSECETILQELLDWLDSRKIPDLMKESLHLSLTHVVNEIHRLGESIHKTYFAVEMQPPSSIASESKPTQSQSQNL